MALFKIDFPSVPFNPTEPPIPAIGLIIKPNINLDSDILIDKNKKKNKKLVLFFKHLF
jgi:hypothetical protein